MAPGQAGVEGDVELDPPDVEVCTDCGADTDGRHTAPDYTLGYHPGSRGPVVCEACLKLYDPDL